MSGTSKIKLRNACGIPEVRFRAAHPSGYKFRVDVDDGGSLAVDQVPVGNYVLTAARLPEDTPLDSVSFSASTTMGIAAIIVREPQSPQPYKIVVECFVIPDTCAGGGSQFWGGDGPSPLIPLGGEGPTPLLYVPTDIAANTAQISSATTEASPFVFGAVGAPPTDVKIFEWSDTLNVVQGAELYLRRR
jgi:hypothetical protein